MTGGSLTEIISMVIFTVFVISLSAEYTSYINESAPFKLAYGVYVISASADKSRRPF